tara:strand:+ start:948 stop:2303 length:1356 start_codon:yes stop_codon:yes gene_type:complete
VPRYTSEHIIQECGDILLGPLSRSRHWGRIVERIRARTGVTLTTKEAKALHVEAMSVFNSIGTLDSSASIENTTSTQVGTDTSIKVIRDDEEISVSSKGIRTIADLMNAARLDPGDWTVESVTPNYWESVRADGGINPHFQIRARFKRFPEWAEAITAPQPLPQVRRDSPKRKALFIPDTQHGFRRMESGEMEPMHDVRACALAVEVVREWQPDIIYLLGDHLDLAPWSKYSKPASVMQTTNATLRSVHDWIAEIRRAARHADIYYCEGNHESRIYRSIVDRLGEAENLRTATGERAVLSIPNLLDLDSLDVKYIEPYGKEHVLWDKIGVSHGTKHGNKVGALLSKRLPGSTYSWVQGHDHKLALGTRAIHEKGKIRHITGMCPGTLSRVDGAVPGVSLYPNWSQGLGFAVIAGSDAHMWVSPILNGTICVSGRVLTANGRDTASTEPSHT